MRVFDENACLIRDIGTSVTVFPTITGEIVRTEDGYCGARLFLECAEDYQVMWEDSEGRTGSSNQFTGLENTAGTVAFHVWRIVDGLNFLPVDSTCIHTTFEADYNCIPDCPEPVFEETRIIGCHGEVVNLFEKLELSPTIRYEVDNQLFTNLGALELTNNGEDCGLRESVLNVKIYDDDGCLIREIKIMLIVLPIIRAQVIKENECHLRLDVACPDLYDIQWEDNLGNKGNGPVYEAIPGTVGVVTFQVRFKDNSFGTGLIEEACLYGLFKEDFACCQPLGTLCDDGDEETFGDREDGHCVCVGTPCKMEYRGKVVDYSNLGGCQLVIELLNGRYS